MAHQVSRYDLAHLQAEPAWQVLQQRLQQESNDLIKQLAFQECTDKERYEKRGRLLLIQELLLWVERSEEQLPKEPRAASKPSA